MQKEDEFWWRTRFMIWYAPRSVWEMWRHVFGGKSAKLLTLYALLPTLLVLNAFVRTEPGTWLRWFGVGFALFCTVFVLPAAFYLMGKGMPRRGPRTRIGFGK